MKSSSRFSLRGLTPQLFLFFILPLFLLLLVVTVGGVTLHQREMRQMVGQRDQLVVRAAAKALAALEKGLGVIKVLAMLQ